MAGCGVVFIVGAPRSGTYLLVTRLSALFPLAIPVETHFMPLFQRVLPLWGDLGIEGNRRRLLACIYDFLEIFTPRSERGRNWEQIRRYSLLATKAHAEAIVSRSSNYQQLIAGLYQEYAKLHGAHLAGDKSAFFFPLPLELLAQVVPHLKVIHIVRDGRDVCLSWQAIWTGPETLTEAAYLWRDHVRDKQRWGKAHPDRYLEVRYEDLLEDPQGVFNRLGVFLGLPRSDFAPERSAIAQVLAEGATHHKVAEPLDSGNKEKWKYLMSDSDQALFEYHAGSVLRDNGYPTVDRIYTTRERFYYALLLVGARLRAWLSLRRWRLWLKSVLPVAIWMARRCRFPLVKALNRRSR